MRTKTLLLTAALAAAGAATSMAQSTVYSVNAVGYINKSINVNAQYVGAPFEVADYGLNALLPPDQIKNDLAVYKPAPGGGFQSAFFLVDDGFWDDPAGITIDQGGGVIVISNPTPLSGGAVAAPFNVTSVGQVAQSASISTSLHTLVKAGAGFYSSRVPQTGLITADLKFVPQANVVAYFLNAAGTAFDPSSPAFYAPGDGFWDPVEPSLGYAQAIVLETAVDQNWDRCFRVSEVCN